MRDRGNRFNQAAASVGRLEKILSEWGFLVTRIGQEDWLSWELYQLIRTIHDDKTVDLVRYFPDLATYRDDIGLRLLQVKSTSKNYWDGPNFSIEQSSFDVDVGLCRFGAKVMVVWENKPGEFKGEYADVIQPIKRVPFEETKFYVGSGTPLALVLKSSVPEFSIDVLRR